MLNFIKFFHGYLLVTVSGYSPERFLNLCSNLNIVLWGIHPVEDGYVFYISRKAFGLIGPALEKTGTEIHVDKKIGIPFLLRRYRKHWFFLVGIGCAGFLLVFMSQFIWRVEISGNSHFSTQMLLKGLAEHNIGYASFKSSINCKELQTMLRKQYEDITWVSAKVEGTRLYIEVQERLKGADETDDESKEGLKPTNLIASADGVIQSITTRRGTPQVTAGDEVSRGDVLVSGIVEIQNDSGDVAARNYVSADADVIIHTTIPYEDSFSKKIEKKRLTGKNKVRWILVFNQYYLEPFPLKETENVIVIREEIPVKIGTDFYLPFGLIRQEAKSYKVEQLILSEKEIRSLVEEHLKEYQKKLIENGIQIISNSVIIKNSGEKISASGNLTVDIYQKDYQEISAEEMQEGTHLDGIDTGNAGDTR